MADVHLWEKGTIQCKAVGIPSTVKKAAFNFYKGTEKVGTAKARLSKESLPEPPEDPPTTPPSGGGDSPPSGGDSGGGSGPTTGGGSSGGGDSPPSGGDVPPTAPPDPQISGVRAVPKERTQRARAKFTAPEPGPEDAFVKLSYKLELDGKEKEGFIHDVYVWAKKIKIKSLKQEDGAPLPRAKILIKQQDPKKSGKKGLSELQRVTGDNGELEHDLVYPAEATVSFERPFVWKSWEKGTASSGRERHAKVERGFIAKLVFPDPSASPDPDPRPTADKTKVQHIQWVNIDPSVETNPPESWGRKIKIRVGAVNPATVILNTDKVFFKAKWEATNLDRPGFQSPIPPTDIAKGVVAAHPDWPKPGKEVTEEKLVSAQNKEVEFELDLGPTGGDRVTVSVGGTSDCSDAKIEIVNWRMLMFELKYPECIEPLLETGRELPLSMKVGQNRATALGLKAATTDWYTERLQKGFVAFYMRGSHGVDDDYDKFEDAIIKGKYLRPYKTAGSFGDDDSVFVYGDWVDRAGGWMAASNRCVQVTLVHAALSSSRDTSGKPAYKTVRHTASATADADIDIKAGAGGWLFPNCMGESTVKPSVKSIKWRAVVETATGIKKFFRDLVHPAIKGGVPLEGTITVDDTNVTYVDAKTLRVKLPDEVKKWVGAKSTTKCPVEITVKVCPAHGINGSAGSGKQVMVVERPPESIACTICHELGHSMGMAVYPDGSRKKPAPRGMANPVKIAAGLVYDDTTMHAGAHCAFGISATDRALPKLGNKTGTCIMYGSGGDEVPPKRDKYCADCETYLKGRQLHDICSFWGSKTADDG